MYVIIQKNIFTKHYWTRIRLFFQHLNLRLFTSVSYIKLQVSILLKFRPFVTNKPFLASNVLDAAVNMPYTIQTLATIKKMTDKTCYILYLHIKLDTPPPLQPHSLFRQCRDFFFFCLLLFNKNFNKRKNIYK